MVHVDENSLDFANLLDIVARLRSPSGCSWDREQNHYSLRRHLMEESYEVLEAIDLEDSEKLCEELGDVLLQIALHTQIAEEAGEFSMRDLLTRLSRKLVSRHPHVFVKSRALNAEEVERQWNDLKREEKGCNFSPVNGIPKEMPALAYAQLMQERVSKSGFDWEEVGGVLSKIAEEIYELEEAELEGDPLKEMNEFGDLLFSLVNLGRWKGIYAEDALRGASRRFRNRYLKMEELAQQQGQHLANFSAAELDALWAKSKRIVG